MRKYKESNLHNLAKAKEAGLWEWDIVFKGEVIGFVERTRAGGYKAQDAQGDYIGIGTTKKEARTFIVMKHVGESNIIWEGEE